MNSWARCSWLHQGGTTERLTPPSLGEGMEAFVFLQTVENGRQIRIRLEHILNVPRGYACDVFFACGLAGRPF